jgi:hypothetical protein
MTVREMGPDDPAMKAMPLSSEVIAIAGDRRPIARVSFSRNG